MLGKSEQQRLREFQFGEMVAICDHLRFYGGGELGALGQQRPTSSPINFQLLRRRQTALEYAFSPLRLIDQMQLGARVQQSHLHLLPDVVQLAGTRIDFQRVGVFGFRSDRMLSRLEFGEEIRSGRSLTQWFAICLYIHAHGSAHGFIAIDIEAGRIRLGGKRLQGRILRCIAHRNRGAANQAERQECCNDTGFFNMQAPLVVKTKLCSGALVSKLRVMFIQPSVEFFRHQVETIAAS